jgi:hypothetical protein
MPPSCQPRTFLKSFPIRWATSYSSDDPQHCEISCRLLDMAGAKLLGSVSSSPSLSDTAKLACIAVRFPLDFRITREANLKAASLVKQHMRVAFGVHANREVLDSGSPSEPILVEASSQLFPLDTQPGNGDTPLEVLTKAYSQQWLAKGERGEMVGRFLWLAARDAAVTALQTTKAADGIQYHQPIRLLSVLENMFVPEVWDVIRHARPVGLGQNGDRGPTLEHAFRNAWTTFTHFSRAADSKVIQLPHLSNFLVRGVALQCADNQKDVDNITPLHFEEDLVSAPRSEELLTSENLTSNTTPVVSAVGQSLPIAGGNFPVAESLNVTAGLDGNTVAVDASLDWDLEVQPTPDIKPAEMSDEEPSPSPSRQPNYEFTRPVCPENTSGALVQIKNRQDAVSLLVNPNIICSEGNNRPTPCLVMELGVRNPERLVEVTCIGKRTRSGHSPYSNVYQIVVYGATSEIYRVIPQEDNNRVATLLATTPFFEGFPRQATNECLSTLRRMKPVFEARAEAMDWAHLEGRLKTSSLSTAPVPSTESHDKASSNDMTEAQRKKKKKTT